MIKRSKKGVKDENQVRENVQKDVIKQMHKRQNIIKERKIPRKQIINILQQEGNEGR